MSKYPVGFHGCFSCGGDGHRNNRECPKRLAGDFNKEEFFLELWAHKPHTKRPAYGTITDNVPRTNQYGPGQSYRTSTNENTSHTNTNTNMHNEIQNGSRRVDTSCYGQANTNNDNRNGSRNHESRHGQVNTNTNHDNTTTIVQVKTEENPDSRCNVNNDPAWMQSSNSSSKQDDRSKKPRLFVYAAKVFSAHTH